MVLGNLVSGLCLDMAFGKSITKSLSNFLGLQMGENWLKRNNKYSVEEKIKGESKVLSGDVTST